MKKPKVLFLYFMEPELEKFWRDGLWAALELLDKDLDIYKWNLYHGDGYDAGSFDFVLGWGAWRSPADNALHKIRMVNKTKPTGLCIGGNAVPPFMPDDHSILFFETPWYAKYISSHKRIKHAFGVNRKVFRHFEKADFEAYTRTSRGDEAPFLYDYLSVGSFSLWKRHEHILQKTGKRLVIGQIQKNNIAESMDIIGNLLLGNVGVSDMIGGDALNLLYNLSKVCYIPADINGGGERTLLEARSAGIKVEVDNDNPKLLELLQSPIWDAQYYADRLKEGILECLSDL